MKLFAIIFALFIVLLSASNQDGNNNSNNNNRPWNLCKGQKIHNAPYYCRQPECSQLCANLHPNITGFGSCRSEVCQCLFFCPADRNARRDFVKKHRLSKLPTSSSSSSSSRNIQKHKP